MFSNPDQIHVHRSRSLKSDTAKPAHSFHSVASRCFLWIFLAALFTLEARAENKKFVVFLKDKVTGNPFSLNNPSAFLSSRSLQRRQSQNLALDSTDLPVKPAYIQGIRNLGAVVEYPLKWLNGLIVECPPELIPQIQALPYVVGSSPLNTKVRNPIRRDLPNNGTQSLDYGPSQNQTAMIGIDSMHAWGFRGEGKMIAVMDAGFQNVNTHACFSHLFLNNQIAGTRDLVAKDGDVYADHWHGAAVLSTLGGYDPGKLIGGAYKSSYFLIRTEDAASEYEVECAYWEVGIELADSIGADLVNSSLGYTTFDLSSLNYSYDDLNGATSVASRAAAMAASKGILVCTSAGNEGANNSWGGWISVPADAQNILTVGSVNPTGQYSTFSGKGPTADGRIKPDLVAQGGNVYMANVFSSDGYTTNGGTSFSCPILCGMAAGFWQAHPGKSALEIIDLLKNSSSNRENPNNQIGWGIPGFVKAHILAGSKPILSFPFDVRIFPNPKRGGKLSIDLLESNCVGNAAVRLVDVRGTEILNQNLHFDLTKTRNEIALPKISPGVYILQLEMGGKAFQQKLLVDEP